MALTLLKEITSDIKPSCIFCIVDDSGRLIFHMLCNRSIKLLQMRFTAQFTHSGHDEQSLHNNGMNRCVNIVRALGCVGVERYSFIHHAVYN